mmetsp:Transcript_49296/g.111856  ORF Transcript_49296/g.111856 Transcript_49296/m.111856 type:complete len:97 (-) Transcript_49296:120-410(-)
MTTDRSEKTNSQGKAGRRTAAEPSEHGKNSDDDSEKRGVVVMVTRWYGGIKLGPDRFRIITNAARDLLSEHGFGKRTSAERSKGSSSGRMKNKGRT